MDSDLITMEKLNNTKIRKHNLLIESHYDLKEIHQKIVLIMCSFIRLEDTSFREIKMKVTDMFKLLGLTATNHKYLDEITDELTTKRVRYKAVIDGVPEMVSVPWMRIAKYRKGYVYLRFNDEIADFLLNLRGNFTSLSLIVAILLSGKYTKRIYELLSQYKNIGHRTISLEELRAMLALSGNKYARWVDFKRYVIDHAQQQINDIADIKFTYTPIKSGRKVDKIKFNISENKNNKDKLKNRINSTSETDANTLATKIEEFDKSILDKNPNISLDLASFIMDNFEQSELDDLKIKLNKYFAYSEKEITNIIDGYQQHYINQKLSYYLEIRDSSNIKNPSGWFKKALSENYESKNANGQNLDSDIFYTDPEAERIADLTVKMQELKLHANSLKKDIESPVAMKNSSIKKQYEHELNKTIEQIDLTQTEIETLSKY